MIFRDQNLIFVHIQKTGGSAIASALGALPEPGEKHRSAVELRDRYGVEAWDSCFKFAFVRNPWDRLVSWWSMINAYRNQVGPLSSPTSFHHFVLARATTFPEFLRNCDEDFDDADGRKWIYRNQIDYVADTDGKLMVDFVGRFERLQADFDGIVRERVGHSLALPKINVSSHRPYTDYYTSDLADLVGQRCARDIEIFGYRFGD